MFYIRARLYMHCIDHLAITGINSGDITMICDPNYYFIHGIVEQTDTGFNTTRAGVQK